LGAGAWVGRQQLEHVLDVDHADRVVEGLAIDRHPRMLGLDELGDQGLERGGDLDGDDVGPRRHHVGDPQGLEGLGLVDDVDGAAGAVRGRKARPATSRFACASCEGRPERPGSVSWTGGLD
jgi:hypothetical protein